jgi:hypothetical protein
MPDRCLTSIIFETGILFRVKMIFGEAFRIAIGLSFHWYAFRWYEYGVDDSYRSRDEGYRLFSCRWRALLTDQYADLLRGLVSCSVAR